MTRSDNEIVNAFLPLWQDIRQDEQFPFSRPLLAHYTSMTTLESIMANDELWFSNPLYMNDAEELKFGILEGAKAFRENQAIKSVCGSQNRYELLANAFEHWFNHFSIYHVLDTYVFCLSNHDSRKDDDGRLSMRRGYGSNGNGVAIIFDTAKIEPVQNSPIKIGKVSYASREDRLQWLDKILTSFAELMRNISVPDDKLQLPAYALFERIKTFSLFTKHKGFSEEEEWRIVYQSERDVARRLEGMLHYTTGQSGIEPKLKLKITPIDGIMQGDISLSTIVNKIILGPSVSGPLSESVVRRMLEKVGKHELAARVISSAIPFRPA